MAILDFSQELMVPSYVYGIDDVGTLDDFASYTLKKIKHDSDGMLDLHPGNTVVACSSPVGEQYERLGFKILPMELADAANYSLHTPSPWDLVEKIGASPQPWHANAEIFNQMHQSSFLIWHQYKLAEKVRMLFSDDMIGSDGDLTESRDYSSYVRQMDDIALLKYHETSQHIKPGRIGDIGCAVGTWILHACKDARFRESDFFGIEVARHLYQICLQRKENGEFANPCVFFAQKNAVTGLCFEPSSMDTIHTSSLTHEIESYGDRQDLTVFIQNRFQELAPGGVWVNRDVVGPDEKDKQVWLWMENEKGNPNGSTLDRFQRFAEEFRREEGDGIRFDWEVREGMTLAKISLGDAMEFISKKDYLDNWNSEMHEKFCFWSFSDWQKSLESIGFQVLPESKSYRNEWLVKNRFEGKVQLLELDPTGKLVNHPWPVTHMLMIARRNA